MTKNLLCRLFGHAMAPRYREDVETVGEISHTRRAYIGEVCPRCGATTPDKLNPPPIITAVSHARLFMEGREPVDIAVDHVAASASRMQGIEFTIRGRARD